MLSALALGYVAGFVMARTQLDLELSRELDALWKRSPGVKKENDSAR